MRVTLRRLAGHGKVRQDGDRWRIHGPAVSPQREEDDPEPAAPSSSSGDPMVTRVITELRSGPLAVRDLVANLGESSRTIILALGKARRAGLAFSSGHSAAARWQLGRAPGLDDGKARDAARKRPQKSYGVQPTAAPEGLGRNHPVVAPLYEQRDRLDRAIAILEGRA